MKKFVIGIALLLISVAGFAADVPGTPQITPPTNGGDWMKLSSTEKLFWSIGYAQGYQDALGKIDVASGPNSPCSTLAARTERQTATAGKVSGFELVSGLEKFYSDPANVQVPIGNAIRIYLLQASGKDQTTIQELIETARVLGATAARRPQQ
ncbi:MAG TPA: hypothetical protein VKH35_08355 [Thermoanaerobaculia bacterium]|jgi:hypothetical protein|nr:hypothetical protein [Thermoanaerobaculia bacterium]